MKKAALALLSLAALAGAAAAQVPAPDFQIEVMALQLNSCQALLIVDGPPNSPGTIYWTPYNPNTSPLGTGMRRYAPIVLDGNGRAVVPLAFQYQGPLPDVWFGAVLRPPAQPRMRALVHTPNVQLAGAFAFALSPDSASVISYTEKTNELGVRVRTTPNTEVSIWEVECNTAPFTGSPFDPDAPGNTLVGVGDSNAGGGFAWSGTVPIARCILIVANGVVIGARRK